MAAKSQSERKKKRQIRSTNTKKSSKASAAAKNHGKAAVVKARKSKAHLHIRAKKARKANKEKQPSVKRKEETQVLVYIPETPDSYNHAIIKDLLTSRSSEESLVSSEAIMFSKLIMYLSMPSGEQYKSGFRLGKLYYGQAVSRRPKWYEDSIPELAKFFQKLGYATEYVISRHGNPVLTLKSNASFKLGFNMHSFEAGIISGFLSSARNSYVAMHESECACNGAEECVFETGQRGEPPIDRNALMRNFAKHLAASHIKKRELGDFSWLYNAIIISTVKHIRGSIPEMHTLGEYASKEFGFDALDSRTPVRMILEIMRKVSASSNSEYNGSGIKFMFDPLNSDSRYMDSLEKFASGLTDGAAKITISLSDSGLSYALGISFGAKLLKLKNK
jgi:predicted hydrocarbon binding protein